MNHIEVRAPQVSILLATRNRLPYLRLALDSARQQTLRQIEIVVSDDGSTDGSQAYVSAVAARDERVRLLTDNPVHGVYENYLHLLAHATSDYVLFFGDDDLLQPTFLEELLAGFVHPDVVVSYAPFNIIDAKGVQQTWASRRVARFYGYDETPEGVQPDTVYVALRGQLWLGAGLYRTTLVRELGLNHQRFDSAADWDLALRVAERGSAYFVPHALWSYRDHGGTFSRRSYAASRQAAIKVLVARSYDKARNEALRKTRLRRELLQLAIHETPENQALAREALGAYRAADGSAWSPRFVVVAVALGLPGPMGRWLHQWIGELRSARVHRRARETKTPSRKDIQKS